MKSKTKKLTFCALMVALATVLGFIKLFEAPYGGAVTLGSMVPLVIVSVYLNDIRWSFLTCLAYSLIQLIIGFYAPPTPTFACFAAVILLDYIFAYGAFALANPISKAFKGKVTGIAFSAALCCLIRFICHFITGMLIWNVYANAHSAWAYSLLYNGGYMLPELIITVVLSALSATVLKKIKK